MFASLKLGSPLRLASLFFPVWFVAGPAMILLGNSLIAKWVREKVIVSVEHCVAFLGHAAFLLITRYARLVKTDRLWE